MPPSQLKGRLVVGFLIGLDRQDPQGDKAFCDFSPGDTPAPFSHQQRVAYLQVPKLRHKRAVLDETFHHVVSPWNVFVVVEPR